MAVDFVSYYYAICLLAAMLPYGWIRYWYAVTASFQSSIYHRVPV